MSKKERKTRVNITIDNDLAKRWSRVADHFGWRRSNMVEDFLQEALPFLEKLIEDGNYPKRVLSLSLDEMGRKMQNLADILEK